MTSDTISLHVELRLMIPVTTRAAARETGRSGGAVPEGRDTPQARRWDPPYPSKRGPSVRP